MFQQVIGKRSERIKNTVERGAVKAFANAIGDPHPLFIDEAHGKRSRYRENLAPPTFPRTFAYGKIEGLDLPAEGLIHGEQVYEYKRPLFIGEEVYVYSEVKDYQEKTGKSGTMGLLTMMTCGETQDREVIFSSTQVIIMNDAVRRAWTG
ncbi:MaoC family dehydratase N-terminal domain-containing protein [Shouchella sp. 1P09AA]|uniref:MaoC family dehydratase N-terminal domain-containing protein n=1 Tax=unclassified Shouchella TaxID=2893065 RepID=UPI0039A0F260